MEEIFKSLIITKEEIESIKSAAIAEREKQQIKVLSELSDIIRSYIFKDELYFEIADTAFLKSKLFYTVTRYDINIYAPEEIYTFTEYTTLWKGYCSRMRKNGIYIEYNQEREVVIVEIKRS